MAKSKPARRAKVAPPGAGAVYQLKVTLLGSKPPIWRRLLVSPDTTLADFHGIVQCAVGWTNSHLHQFYDTNRTFYSDPGFGLEDTQDESNVHVGDLLKKPKDRIVYQYDFGDDWEHGIELEKLLPPSEGEKYPACVAGKRAGPPEDCGGVWGYADFVEVIRDPKHENHDEMMDWVGGEFDPEAFDLDAINRCLRRL